MSRRRWFALLPVGAGAVVVSLFAVGVLPPGSAQPDSESRPDAAAVSVPQTPAESSPSATTTAPTASPLATSTTP
ncbi:MAG TPA: hypothetical protein VF714_08560, partial [Jatrophihabitans sp.]